MNRESGFSLVELMVIIAIVAILASVATPAYINYVNRSKQTEAVEALLRAKMDQEAFFAENNRYASTICLLSSFGNTNITTFSTPSLYRISVAAGANTFKFQINAARTIRGQANTLSIMVSANTQNAPINVGKTGLNYSVFNWLFN